MVTQGAEQVISQDVVSDETLLNIPWGLTLHVEPRDRYTTQLHLHILTQRIRCHIGVMHICLPMSIGLVICIVWCGWWTVFSFYPSLFRLTCVHVIWFLFTLLHLFYAIHRSTDIHFMVWMKLKFNLTYSKLTYSTLACSVMIWCHLCIYSDSL